MFLPSGDLKIDQQPARIAPQCAHIRHFKVSLPSFLLAPARTRSNALASISREIYIRVAYSVRVNSALVLTELTIIPILGQTRVEAYEHLVYASPFAVLYCQENITTTQRMPFTFFSSS